MMNLEGSWIKRESRNGEKMLSLLERIAEWRHNCGLAGQKIKYDYFHSCYGNPNSDIVFIAEMASLRGLDKAINGKIVAVDRLWTTPWYGDGSGLLVPRRALAKRGFIPDAHSDKPWTWNCWITNFVKCPEYNEKWRRMSKERRERILEESSAFLAEEIKIIDPKAIVIIGKTQTRPYYFRFIEGRNLLHKPIHIFVTMHYARIKRKNQKDYRIFRSEFRRMKKWYDEGATHCVIKS